MDYLTIGVIWVFLIDGLILLASKRYFPLTNDDAKNLFINWLLMPYIVLGIFLGSKIIEIKILALISELKITFNIINGNSYIEISVKILLFLIAIIIVITVFFLAIKRLNDKISIKRDIKKDERSFSQ